MRPIPITNLDHTAEELEQLAKNCKQGPCLGPSFAGGFDGAAGSAPP